MMKRKIFDLMAYADSFVFCTDDEKRRLYAVLTQAWVWSTKR